MKSLYRFILALIATSWVVVVFGIKEGWAICGMPVWTTSVLLIVVPFTLSFISLHSTKLLGRDTLTKCKNIEEVDNSFLSIYLAYFFVGLGVQQVQHLIFVYLIILIFTYVSQTPFCNPIFLVFGYHFYNTETPEGTKILLIAKENLRRANDVNFENLRRINDNIYIKWGE